VNIRPPPLLGIDLIPHLTNCAFMLIIIVAAGARPYSLDALIPGLMNKHVAWHRILTGLFAPWTVGGQGVPSTAM
jgi:hypothetical protein